MLTFLKWDVAQDKLFVLVDVTTEASERDKGNSFNFAQMCSPLHNRLIAGRFQKQVWDCTDVVRACDLCPVSCILIFR